MTIVLTVGNISASDMDTDDSSLTFTVSNLSGGQFLVDGSSATSFTQSQIAAGQVAFAHDDGELAPTFDVEVSDGTYSDGPQSTSISFANVNDNAPQVPAGQAFSVSEDALVGTNLGTVSFSDSDLPGDTLVASVSAGNDDGVFDIATDGIDVWIVDARSDRVYQYTGAATRLSGSQDAASNFKLTSGNRSPKGITTDGSSLWVVNNSSTDRVYKYTTSGSLLGNWSIDSANSRPMGITIDPANVDHIWIVDKATDRIYEYTNAASRTSGSQSAAASFGLASGNNNPQGIADPPVTPTRVEPNDASVPDSPFAIYVGDSFASTRNSAVKNSADNVTPLKSKITEQARERLFDLLAAKGSFVSTIRSQSNCTSMSDRDVLNPDLIDDDLAALDVAIELAVTSEFES